MSNSPDVPNVPDPGVTASKQFDLNKQAGLMSQQGSMVNQSNPFGELTYSQTGTSPDGTPLYTAKTTLNSSQQELLDILNGTKKTAGTQAGNLLTGANYGAAQPKDVIGDMSGGWLKDAMTKQMSYLQPGFDYDIAKMETKLKNQGFAQGDPAYDKAMNALKQSQGQTVTGFQASQQPALLQQAAQLYQMPAQLAGSLSGLGAPTMPTWNNTPNLNIQSPDLIGATNSANAANMKAYEAQSNKDNAMMSGIMGVPSAILGGWAQNGGLQALMGSAALAAV
jgi:hypothetical protein